ncbi:MAG: OmpH family outer membrane protein [Thermodesulfobacteriota bacterium]|nr:OmpH family outer membrane protein [Thermodesulfobacteriota bacterium]
MKDLCLVLMVTLVLSFPGLALGDNPIKIGYVDMQEALNSSISGKEARREFSNRVKKTEDLLEAKQNELKELKGSFEKQSLVLSEDARKEKEKEYQNRMRDYQRLIKDSQQELKSEESEMVKKIFKELRVIIYKIGGKGDYTMIFEKNASGILYGSETADLTDELIKAYDKEKK